MQTNLTIVYAFDILLYLYWDIYICTFTLLRGSESDIIVAAASQ